MLSRFVALARPLANPHKHHHCREFSTVNPRVPPFNGAAMSFSGGIWHDPSNARTGLYKLYYNCGYNNYLCLAVSDDGVTFRKESYDVVPGTNVVITIPFDGAAVWLDETVPAGSPERYAPPSRNLPRAC